MISGRARGWLIVCAAAGAVLGMLFLGLLAARLHALRTLRAAGPGWSFPSRVYSDGIPLVVGRALPEPYVLAQLTARGYRPVTTQTPPGTYRKTPDGFEIGLRGMQDEPPPVGGGGPEALRLRIADGYLVGLERLGGFPGATPPDTSQPPAIEPALVSLLFGEDRVWRTWVSLDRIPKAVQDAILASEDRRFYGHIGVDVRGSARALFTNIRAGEIREGGSTITQQLVRSLFVGRERTLLRKLAEIPLAVGVEILLPKTKILEMYLNSVYWGQAQGFSVGGVAEAARWYFDAPIESLGVVQGATLAAIIPAPNMLNPFEYPSRTLERRNAVLKDMAMTDRLEQGVATRLAGLPLGLRQGRPPIERFPSYTGYVKSVLKARMSRDAASHYGLVVMTPMDLAWQAIAEHGLTTGLISLDGSGKRRLQGAFVALEPASSGILAIVGGRAADPGDFNRAYQARRQTGSAIKPIVYAAALAGQHGLTPASTLPDTLRTFGKGRWRWTPRNFDHSTHVEVTLAKALGKSLNIATANLVDLIGAAEVARAAERFGLGRLKAVASIGLGTNETSLLQLTNAFAVFRQRGMLRTPFAIRSVVDRSGRQVMRSEERAVQVVPEGIAALMTGLLQNVVRHGVAYPLRGTYGFDRPVAGKTGTTDDFRDAWFVGFTPDLIAGVWVGYDRPRSIGRQAAHTAIPVWARVMGRMLDGFPPIPFETDTQLEWLNIDPWSGFLSDSLCPSESVPFLPGSGPLASCTEGQFYTYGYESPDSLYGRDTLWFDEPEEPLPVEPIAPWEPADPESVVVDTVEIDEERPFAPDSAVGLLRKRQTVQRRAFAVNQRAAHLPATIPLLHAHWKLNPPSLPSTSRISPHR